MALLDIAIFTCLTTTFGLMARLGEFTAPSLAAFNGTIHITQAHIREEVDRKGGKVAVFTLLHSKSSPQGEDIY